MVIMTRVLRSKKVCSSQNHKENTGVGKRTNKNCNIIHTIHSNLSNCSPDFAGEIFDLDPVAVDKLRPLSNKENTNLKSSCHDSSVAFKKSARSTRRNGLAQNKENSVKPPVIADKDGKKTSSVIGVTPNSKDPKIPDHVLKTVSSKRPLTEVKLCNIQDPEDISRNKFNNLNNSLQSLKGSLSPTLWYNAWNDYNTHTEQHEKDNLNTVKSVKKVNKKERKKVEPGRIGECNKFKSQNRQPSPVRRLTKKPLRFYDYIVDVPKKSPKRKSQELVDSCESDNVISSTSSVLTQEVPAKARGKKGITTVSPTLEILCPASSPESSEKSQSKKSSDSVVSSESRIAEACSGCSDSSDSSTQKLVPTLVDSPRQKPVSKSLRSKSQVKNQINSAPNKVLTTRQDNTAHLKDSASKTISKVNSRGRGKKIVHIVLPRETCSPSSGGSSQEVCFSKSASANSACANRQSLGLDNKVNKNIVPRKPPQATPKSILQHCSSNSGLKRIPIYRNIRKSPPLQTMDAKANMYSFEVDENEEPVQKKKKVVRTQKVRKRARIVVRHYNEKKTNTRKKKAAVPLVEKNDVVQDDYDLFEPVQEADILHAEKEIAKVPAAEEEDADMMDNDFDDIVETSVLEGITRIPQQSTPAHVDFPEMPSPRFSDVIVSPVVKPKKISTIQNASTPIKPPSEVNRNLDPVMPSPRFSDVDRDILPQSSYAESPVPVFAPSSVHEVSYIEIQNDEKATRASRSLLCQTPRAAWDDHVSYRYCSTPVRENSYNVSAISMGTPVKSSPALDASTCFGFDLPDEVEEVIVSPIKRPGPARLAIAPAAPHSEENGPSTAEVLEIFRHDLGEDSAVPLFAPEVDFSAEVPPKVPDDSSDYFGNSTLTPRPRAQRRSYERPAELRQRNRQYSEPSEDEDHPPPSPVRVQPAPTIPPVKTRKKRQPGPSRKEQAELDKWAAAFNNQCAEISSFNLCIE